jgi:hypothetical protein
VEDPDSSNFFPTTFIVIDVSFERLNLKFLCPGRRDLDVVVFVEEQRDVVFRFLSLHLLTAVGLELLRFFRIEVEPLD